MTKRFEGQVVVITGGGRGIGRATALEFAAEGATLVLAGRRMEALRLAVREVHEAGGKGRAVRCDVAEEAQLEALVGGAKRAYGRIDVLVNNAGVVAGGRLDEIDPEDVNRMVTVNIWAPIRLSQLVIPHMRAARSGTIVNLASLAGRIALPYYATYSASKYAMRGFSEALRRELAPDNIHVMGVYPGGTATDMLEGVDFDRLGMSLVTAGQVGSAILRGVHRGSREIFIGPFDAAIAHWNDLVPWAIDRGVDLMRDRVRSAVEQQRST